MNSNTKAKKHRVSMTLKDIETSMEVAKRAEDWELYVKFKQYRTMILNGALKPAYSVKDYTVKPLVRAIIAGNDTKH